MRAFELHTCDGQGGQFAPLRLWTSEARAESDEWKSAEKPAQRKLASHINRWAQIYCYVISLSTPPSSIQDSLGVLKTKSSGPSGGGDEEVEEEGSEEVVVRRVKKPN